MFVKLVNDFELLNILSAIFSWLLILVALPSFPAESLEIS